MKTLAQQLTVFISALLLISAGQAQARTPEDVQKLMEYTPPQEFSLVPGEIIAKMEPTVGFTAEDLTELGIQAEKQVTSGGETIYRIMPSMMRTYTPDEARDRTLALVDELNERPNVVYAQPNYILHAALTPNDPLYPDQWHYFDNGTGSEESPGGIGLPTAWGTTTGDAGMVVAVLDTGILPNHPDISASPNLLPGYDMITDSTRANDGDGRDADPTDPGDAIATDECYPGSPALPDSWHGTHVAGTVGVGLTDNGAGVTGINWNVGVLPVRVLGKCGGTTVDINDGIRWAAGLSVPGVPNNPTPARVINMSLGGAPGFPCSRSPSTQAAINDAVAAGAAVVVAAGNDAVNASQVFPASCDNVITAAASDYRGYLVTRYSNYGNAVDILAPGGDVRRDDNGDGNPDGVLSMIHPNDGSYAWYNGTSMAAPHVAGVAALWLAEDPTLTPAQLLNELQSHALPRTSTECPEPCGAGLLSAVRAAPAPLSVDMVLDPDKTLDVGETTTVRATVSMGGTPQPGETVTFSTSDASVASVSPASAVTNAGGQAESTVRGESNGDATITAAADSTSDTAPVKVPDLTLMGFLILLICVMILGAIRRRRV